MLTAQSRLESISDNAPVHSALKELTPLELGRASTVIRKSMERLAFVELILSPFTAFPIDFDEAVTDVPGLGQLRFNTEPEIWSSASEEDKFFSMSTLFRRERHFNVLRRPAFTVVDYYHLGSADQLMHVFTEVLNDLAAQGLTPRLSHLPYSRSLYDVRIDGPNGNSDEPCWVIASGYDAEHSFYEIGNDGISTRKELFLMTSEGFLEVGVLGITGRNANPYYVTRSSSLRVPEPDFHRSGMCFGLERLLLAEQILAKVYKT